MAMQPCAYQTVSLTTSTVSFGLADAMPAAFTVEANLLKHKQLLGTGRDPGHRYNAMQQLPAEFSVAHL
jgi:hypothetical protein